MTAGREDDSGQIVSKSQIISFLFSICCPFTGKFPVVEFGDRTRFNIKITNPEQLFMLKNNLNDFVLRPIKSNAAYDYFRFGN